MCRRSGALTTPLLHQPLHLPGTKYGVRMYGACRTTHGVTSINGTVDASGEGGDGDTAEEMI